jgi:hypothetical protein
MRYRERQRMIVVYKVRDTLGWVAFVVAVLLTVAAACSI